MRKAILLVLLVLLCVSAAVQAQELSEVYRFVDGTTLNFPSDFLVFNEEYDGLTMASSQTEIAVKVIFARTIEAQRLQSLPQILQYYFAETPDVYTIGAEEAITIGERDAIRFQRSVEGETAYTEIYLAFMVGDNGSAVVLRIQPNTEGGIFELSEETVALQIAESVHFEDIRGDLNTTLGNSAVFDNGLLIEFTSIWTADTAAQTLSSDFASIHLRTFTPEALLANDRKLDLIEVLYYEVYQPGDSSLSFNPDDIQFTNIGGHEGISYSFADTVDGDAVQRTYYLTSLSNGIIVALDMQSQASFAILDDPDTQRMLQTIRPEGTLPPVTMMALGSSFNLAAGAIVRFPDYWRARSVENGVSLDSLDINVFIQRFTTAEAAAFSADLPAALLSLTQPQDSSVQLSADMVETITLENGRTAVTLSYTETTAERSYPRTVYLIMLDDSSAVFVSVTPQFGVNEINEVNAAEVRAILNTITSN